MRPQKKTCYHLKRILLCFAPYQGEKMPRENEVKQMRTNTRERWISIEGAVTAADATNFEKQLAKLAERSRAPVVVFLNSRGGDALACLRMYFSITDLVEKKRVLIHTACAGVAQSGAFFILQAGARRFATKTATFRFHRVIRIYDGQQMNSVALAKELRELVIIDSIQLLLYTERGCPTRRFKALFKRDAHIDAQTALKLSLLDAIIPEGSFSEMLAHIAREQ